ncbi:MAG: hypothetical protein EP344_11145 [Bacteroidetes bacterium]|nr:MAG: hypothetical protein EP344_11145 [Bacteroidota bacterium]
MTYPLYIRRVFRFGVLLCWTLLLLQPAFAQTPLFTVRSAKDVDKDQMRTLYQDRHGWMWFGGEHGLFRYDGINFQPVGLPDTLAGDPVTALYEVNDDLWVGFESGAIGILPANTVFLTAMPHETKANQRSAAPLQHWSPEEGTPQQSITGFRTDSMGNVWIATYGEGIYCWSGNRMYQFGIEDGLASTDIYALECDIKGRIWAATDAGISICSMPEPGRKQIRNLTKTDGLPDEIVSTLLADQFGNMWIGTYDHGVCRYLIREERFDHIIDSWAYGPVSGIALFGSSELWVGTRQNGPVRLDLGSHVGSVRIVPLPNEHPLRKRHIQTLCKDREGLLWALEYKGNIYSANVRIGLLQTPFDNIQAVFVDRRNRLWAGTPQGLFLREDLTFRRILPTAQNVISLWQAPNGNMWVGTYGNGIFILNAQGQTLRHLTEQNGLSNGSIFSITGDADNVWLATLGGATVIRQTNWDDMHHYPELGTNYLYKILVDSKNRIWFGTVGEGLIVLENGKFRQFSEAAGQTLRSIYSIAEDSKGNIWIGTDGNGLFRYDGQSFRQYTTSDHLHSMTVNGLAFDGNGYLILSYEDGIDVLTTETGHVSFFDASSGAPAAESSFNAICRDANGNVWVGARKGILRMASFDESFVYDPEPDITAISIFLQPLDFLSTTRFEHDQNYFLFNFTGLWYTNPELVRYRYRLEGYDHGWVISKEHFASYPALPPGRYAFRLQASEHGEFEGTPEVTYSFTIAHPFWTQWWFVLLALSAGVGLLFYFVRAREKRLYREASLRRKSVESQFEALKSQINPHFLFNSFNTLITIIEEQPKVAVEYVEHLSDFYRSIMVYREKDLISLNEETEIVNNFNFLLKKRYEDSFRFDCRINGQSGSIMPLTLQMLVENAVKHNIISKARPLKVDIAVEDGKYIVVRNNKQRKLKAEPSTHFGLQSLINRYTLLSNLPVLVDETPDTFTVKVPIL